MGETALVDEQIKEGRELVSALDKASFDVKAAFWFYFSNIDDWRLLIASPCVDSSSPMKALEVVQRELGKIPPPFHLKLRQIAVISPQDKLVKLLRVAIRTDPHLSDIRFTQNVINGTLIEDAYIYRNV